MALKVSLEWVIPLSDCSMSSLWQGDTDCMLSVGILDSVGSMKCIVLRVDTYLQNHA